MQVDTGELVRNLEGIPEKHRDGFVQVPEGLVPAAEAVLGEADNTTVTRATQEGCDLMAWAKHERRERNRRKRARKTQRKSLRRNRG
jgi:hypothetical protein